MGPTSQRVARRPSQRADGFSLLELAIYLVLLAALLLPIGMVTTSFSRLSSESGLIAKLSERNRIALQRLADDIQPAMGASTVVTNGGHTLLLTAPGAFAGGPTVAGGMIQYDIQPAADDPANGLDDNGNGLADEYALIRTDLTTFETVVISSNLAANPSVFALAGDGVQVTLAHIGGTTDDNPTVVRLVKTAVIRPKN